MALRKLLLDVAGLLAAKWPEHAGEAVAHDPTRGHLPMTLRDLLFLAVLVAARVGLGIARFAAHPLRFQNFEESYNATVAWMIAHGGMWREILDIQYRSFCGGCSVVALAGTPAMAVSEGLWAWKVVPLAWTAATQVIGFLALDARVGRAAAWAFVALLALPPPGVLDLSLMAWGNHQETGLLLLLALLLVARGHVGAAGFVLGFSTFFARTSWYGVLALLPGALSIPGRRIRALLGLALGAALVAVPAAGGDAGWYRMEAPVGLDLTEMPRRAWTLLSPHGLAERLWLPLHDMAPAGAGLLGVALVAGILALRDRQARVLAALPVAFAVAYVATSFPIFLVNSHVPVNNIRYHAPWAFSLSVLAATGVGLAWRAGRRALATGMAATVLIPGFLGLARLDWAPTPVALETPALDLPLFMGTATPRLSVDDVDAPVAHPRAAAVRARILGLLLGRDVVHRGRSLEEAIRVAGTVPGAFGGLGESLVGPCLPLREVTARLDALPEGAREEADRGAALTLSFCEEGRERGPLAETLAASPDGGRFASALGPSLLARCGGPVVDPEVLAACLREGAAGLPDPPEVLFGAGRAFASPGRPEVEVERVAVALGETGDAFRAGARDIAAGTQSLPFARQGGRRASDGGDPSRMAAPDGAPR